MRYVLGSLALLFVLTGCGSPGVARRVPDVRGQPLDVAERRLEARGLDFEELGGGTFGIVDRDNWTVCEQEPAAGKRARTVRLVVDRECPPGPPRVAGPPRVVGLLVAPALARLHEHGVEADAFTRTGLRVQRGRWVVCAQWPHARKPTYYVQLTVARRCTRR